MKKTGDAKLALRWLLGAGGHTERLRLDTGGHIYSYVGGMDALLRVLRSPNPDCDVMNQLTLVAKSDPAVSDMRMDLVVAAGERRLVLVRRKSGRPPDMYKEVRAFMVARNFLKEPTQEQADSHPQLVKSGKGLHRWRKVALEEAATEIGVSLRELYLAIETLKKNGEGQN